MNIPGGEAAPLPPDDSEINSEVSIEEWKREVVELLLTSGADRKAVEAGVDWGVRWEEACRAECVRRFGSQFEDRKAAPQEMKDIIARTRWDTAREVPDFGRYLGAGSMIRITTIAAARLTFLYTQGEDAPRIGELVGSI